jgi:hypothetical protein
VGSLWWLEVKQSWREKKNSVAKLGTQYTWKMAFNTIRVFQTPWWWCESIIMVLTNLKVINIDLVWILNFKKINIGFIII